MFPSLAFLYNPHIIEFFLIFFFFLSKVFNWRGGNKEIKSTLAFYK